MYGTRVLVLLPLLVGLAQSFSWDIVVGEDQQLKFYNNGTLTHTEDIPSSEDIRSCIYDPVDYRVLFADYRSTNLTISSYDLTTGKIEILVMKFTNSKFYVNLAYDPVKQLLFWSEDNKIYSISLKPALRNTTVDGNFILTTINDCHALVVDSCGGYIYWATNNKIERAAFDGSKREVLVDSDVYWRYSLVINQQTQRMFWSDEINYNNYCSIESADLNGKNRRTFYSTSKDRRATALTISNDYIYWKSLDKRAILRLPKHQQNDVAPTVYANSSTDLWHLPLTAANYTIEEQTLGMKGCEALKSLSQRSTAKSSSELELQGSGSTCVNYCFAGNCSISAEGLPNCSCEAGHTGERCEVDVCHKHCLHGGVCSLNEEEEPVCQCTAGYEGERCDVATSTTGVQAEYTKQEIQQDVRREVKKSIKEELKRVLLFFTHKIDEYDANIEIHQKSIDDHDR